MKHLPHAKNHTYKTRNISTNLTEFKIKKENNR